MPPPMMIIAGPPGSGKGTLCENIQRATNVVHLSTGDLLRVEVKQATELGKKAEEFMSKGKLVPDALIIAMVLQRLKQKDIKERGVLLDGFPRTGGQAEALKKAGVKFDVMVLLEVSEKSLMERSAGRRLDPQTGTIYHLKFNPPPSDVLPRVVIRPDDQPEKQKFRIEVFNKTKAELVAAYQDILLPINADQPIQRVYEEFVRKSMAKKQSKL